VRSSGQSPILASAPRSDGAANPGAEEVSAAADQRCVRLVDASGEQTAKVVAFSTTMPTTGCEVILLEGVGLG